MRTLSATFTCTLALVACAVTNSIQRPSSPGNPAPVFEVTEAAPEGSELRVFVDPDKLVGWIAGSRSYSGRTATILLDGKLARVSIAEDNTFWLPIHIKRAAEAEITVGDLVQRVTVEPPRAIEPTSYIVTDRSAYRPGQKLQFSAFLRRIEAGELRPEIKSPVEVKIVSDTKKLTAAKLSLPVDGRGRVVGDYTFSPADPLDSYTVQIAGYVGDAKVTLAEYRKSKVKLDVDATIIDRVADLRFRALDFLDHGVAGGKVTFKAQIVREPEAQPTLREGFAYGGARATLYRDEVLLHAADPGTATRLWDAGRHVVNELGGTLELDASGVGHYKLPLESTYLRGHHQLVVESTIVDANGREQRTTRTLPLARSEVRMQIMTPHELVAANSPVDVSVRLTDGTGRLIVPASASIAAMRIAPPMPAFTYNNFNFNGNGFDNGNGLVDNGIRRINVNGSHWVGGPNGGHWVGGPNGGHWTGGPNGGHWVTPNQLSNHSCRYTALGCDRLRKLAKRMPRAAIVAPDDTLAGTAAVIGDTATLALADPGAYRLVVSAKLLDGSTVWGETGVAVRDKEVMPAIVLELDRSEIDRGERIAGTLHARYRDAAVLLVVRDATGIRSRHRAVLSNGRARFDLPSADLGYGVAVEAHVLAAEHTIESAQRLVRVVPANRTLTIRTDVKETYGPGETVDLGIDVGGTTEAVDVVVSIYDQSLLGIARDQAIDPRSFFYGDDRLHARAALTILQARLGDLTLGQVLERARAVAKRPASKFPEAEVERQEAAYIVATLQPTGALGVQGVVALLRYLGIAATASDPHDLSAAVTTKPLHENVRVFDVLSSLPGVAFVQVADTIAVFDPSREVMRPVAVPGLSGGGVSGNASFSSGNASPSFSVGPSVSFVAAGPAPISGVAGMGGAGSGDSTGAVRRDFADSALWHVTTTDAQGKARVRFKLPDSLTNWQVSVTALGRRAAGRHTARIRTVRDVMIWPLLPRQFVEGDTIEVGASVHNMTAQDRDITVSLQTERIDILTPATMTLRVARGASVPVTWRVRARDAGLASLLASAVAAGAPPDGSLKRIPIVPASAEQLVTASGFADRPLTLELPDGIEPQHAELELTFAPSLAADMAKTLDYLVEYPYGCAEQTMSRFAPAIEVAGVLNNLGIRDGALVARLPKVVEGGMKRLSELQQPDGGWAWNGHAETHEMITPYVVWGLLRAERAGYKLPDEGTVRRGLERIRQLVDARVGDAALSDRTYLMYVYAQKHKLPDAWWRWLVERADRLSDYALALALEIAVARDRATASRFATALRARAIRTADGLHWRTGSFSRWMEDPIETTAAVVSALVAHDARDPLLTDALAYFAATKRGDRWNSTKDTAMVLYAMTSYVRARQAVTGKGAALDFAVDGGPSRHVTFPDGLVRTVRLDGTKLSRKSTVTFANASPGIMVRAVLRYRTKGRDLRSASDGLLVTRTVHLVEPSGKVIRELKSNDRVPRGSYVSSLVRVAHAQHQAMRYLLIEDPKPAGAEALPDASPRLAGSRQPWVLREDRESHLAFHFEEAGASTQVRTILHLESAGELAFVPASAELMYQTATRGHAGSFVLRVD